MQDLISVIVPVYNVEAFLPECLESIINQTYKNLEIILIDDGSTDNSLNICKEYANKDNRIIVKTQKNMGQSVARNRGIELSHGKYIGFVDSDDIISINMYEYLYKSITESKTNISICDFVIYINGSPCFGVDYKNIEFNNLEILKELMLDQKITNYMVNKLYVKDLFNEIKFPVGRKYEDIAIIYKLFISAGTISYVPINLYAYRRRIGSTTGEYNKKTNMDFIKAIKDRYIDLYDFNKELNIYLKLNRSNMALRYFLDIVKFRKKDILKDHEYMNNLYKELEFAKKHYKEIKKLNSWKRNLLIKLAYTNIYLFYYIVYFYEKISRRVL